MTLFLVANAALAWTGSDAYYDMSASNTADADAPTHSFIDISGHRHAPVRQPRTTTTHPLGRPRPGDVQVLRSDLHAR
ncbi:MAG: hypothetical protein H6736_02895 [Alphaproteobacteria bacterium]|nr:hypothetical protein [Alphaproteobacteria bacterium]